MILLGVAAVDLLTFGLVVVLFPAGESNLNMGTLYATAGLAGVATAKTVGTLFFLLGIRWLWRRPGAAWIARAGYAFAVLFTAFAASTNVLSLWVLLR